MTAKTLDIEFYLPDHVETRTRILTDIQYDILWHGMFSITSARILMSRSRIPVGIDALLDQGSL